MEEKEIRILVSVSLPLSTVQKTDEMRGGVARSKYLRNRIIKVVDREYKEFRGGAIA